MSNVTEMEDGNPNEIAPPENSSLYSACVYESALRQIAAVEWPVNINGTSPQLIARQALKK